MNSIMIFIGSGLGGILRYWFSNLIHYYLGKGFPYGTFFVNFVGCFCMGLLFALIVEHLEHHGSSLIALVLIGILGGYTTFSTFSIETINLFENDNIFLALTYIVTTVLLCLVATALGLTLGRTIVFYYLN